MDKKTKSKKQKKENMQNTQLEMSSEIAQPARQSDSSHMTRKPSSHLQKDAKTNAETSNPDIEDNY